MKPVFRRFLSIMLSLGLWFSFVPASLAVEQEETEQKAENISRARYLTECVGFPNYGYFFDANCIYGGDSVGDEAYFTATHEKGIGSVYIIFQEVYGDYEVTNNDTGATVTVGRERFLHDFLDMQALFGSIPSSVTVRFSSGVVQINELFLFTPGQVPDFVQKWNVPKDGETDLILFSTHSDDEHLFFAGILPYYAAVLDYQVQVVYLTDHRNSTLIRNHEALDGLWAVGVDTYPVFGTYYDFAAENIYDAYSRFYYQGHSKEDLIGFAVEQMRRFKPKVVVAHDFNGEYGHAQHMVYAEMVAQALEVSNDPAYYPQTAEQYGLWDVPKAYFHLYKENEIVMDWDQPQERFGGKSVYEVSVYKGFQCHVSQIWGFEWYYIHFPNAISITRYNPCYYGLYRSTVGEDVEKNDFFENVTTYAQDRAEEEARLAEEARIAEEKRLAEEQRRKEEEAARLQAQAEAEQKAREEALRQQEQQRLEAEAEARRAAEEARLQKQRMLIAAGVVSGIYVLAVIVVFWRKKSSGKKFL